MRAYGKTSRLRALLAGGICGFASIVGIQHACADEKQAASRYRVEASRELHGVATTDKRNWDNFLKLAAKPNGLVSARDAWLAFGRQGKLSNDGSEFENSVIMVQVNRKHNSLPSSANENYINKKGSGVKFYFRNFNAETCFDRKTIREQITHLGWRFFGSTVDHSKPQISLADNSSISFLDVFHERNNSELDIEYHAGCAASALMLSSMLTMVTASPQI